MHRWLWITGLVALGAIFSAGAAPFIAAASGAYRPSDFASNIAAAREIAAGRDPYDADFAPLHAAVLGIPPSEGRPYFPHPPLAAVLIRPLASLSFSNAAAVWFAVSIGLLLLLAVLLSEIATHRRIGGNGGPSGAVVAMTFIALLIWPPVLYNLEKGQWSIVLAVLIALAWRSVADKPGRAGGIVGAAAALKAFPALLVSYLLLRSARAIAWFVIVLCGGVLVPLIWLGFPALSGFVRHSQANLAYWETWTASTYSLDGLFARLLIGGQWAVPVRYLPAAARLLAASVGAVLVAIAMFAAGRRPAGDAREGAGFAAFAILLVILNPLAMGHNGVLLALPIVLIGRTLPLRHRSWPQVCFSAGIVLTSIPKETIFRLCPAPVGPLRGVAIVALPLWGALLLFAVAIALARDGEGSRRVSAD